MPILKNAGKLLNHMASVPLQRVCAPPSRLQACRPLREFVSAVRYSRTLDERARIFEHRGIFRARDGLDAPAGFSHFLAPSS